MFSPTKTSDDYFEHYIAVKFIATSSGFHSGARSCEIAAADAACSATDMHSCGISRSYGYPSILKKNKKKQQMKVAVCQK